MEASQALRCCSCRSSSLMNAKTFFKKATGTRIVFVLPEAHSWGRPVPPCFFFRKFHFCLPPYIFCLCSKTILFVTKLKWPLNHISSCFGCVFILITVMCTPGITPGITQTRLITVKDKRRRGGGHNSADPPASHFYLSLSSPSIKRLYSASAALYLGEPPLATPQISRMILALPQPFACNWWIRSVCSDSRFSEPFCSGSASWFWVIGSERSPSS